VIVEPPLPGEAGAEPESTATTSTSSGSMPRTSATMAWKPPPVPDMSAMPVSTWTLPSGDIRHAAAAALVAPGQ
jgi:hypothetical protein